MTSPVPQTTDGAAVDPHKQRMIDAARHAFSGAAWMGVSTRRELLPQLDARVLLHAGPPVTGAVPAPLLHAAAQALVFEGMADGFEDALRLVEAGAVTLLPAQDHGVVTPLAQVVSASMPLAAVGDESGCAYAPLVEGGPPALRFGSCSPEAVQRLHAVTRLGLDTLHGLLARAPLPMAPLICGAMAAGDECHARTDEANRLLVRGLQGLGPAEASAISAVSAFVLPVLMAASSWVLRHHGRHDPGAVVAAGGNGSTFGIRLAGAPRWHVVDAVPPSGPMFSSAGDAVGLPAVGDSAVIDFCGLGGQALHACPTLQDEWRAWLPADAASRRLAIVNPSAGLVNAFLVVSRGLTPLVNLAVVDAAGVRGLIGRGFYSPPLSLFETALRAPASAMPAF